MWRLVAVYILASCGRAGFDLLDAGAGACTSQLVPTSAVVTGSTVAGSSRASGSCGGIDTSEDVYALDVDVPGSRVQVYADFSTEASDTTMYVRTDCELPSSELACDISSGTGSWPLITMAVPPGRYFVFVDGVGAAQAGDYMAGMQVLLPEGTACDPANVRDRCDGNLTCTGGTCVPATCPIAATMTTSGTQTLSTDGAPDLHAGTCGAGGDGGLRAGERIIQLDLAAAVTDVTVSTDNPGTDFDTLIYMRSSCTTGEVACDDDSGVIDNSSTMSTGPLAAGTYFIFIDGFGFHAGTAEVSVVVTP